MIVRAGGCRNGEIVFDGYGISLGTGKRSGVGGDDGCTTLDATELYT